MEIILLFNILIQFQLLEKYEKYLKKFLVFVL